MKRNILITAMLIASMLLLDGCGKYPEGPSLSILSKRDRIANEWVIHKVYVEDQDVTAIWNIAYPDFLWDIRKDYYFTMLTNGVSVEGTWEFQQDEEKIAFTENGSPTSDVFTIYRLKNDELWLYQRVGTEDTEIHLIPKPKD